jgi:hypothetical protein
MTFTQAKRKESSGQKQHREGRNPKPSRNILGSPFPESE